MSRNYIFIHGAWHGSWIWRDIIPLIQKHNGNRAWAPSLPGHGNSRIKNFRNITLNSYVDFIIDLIKQLELDCVILVGHSMAGVIISQIAEVIPSKILKLIYISGFIPDNNGSLAEEEQKLIIQNIAKAIIIDENNYSISINDSQKIKQIFYNNCNSKDTEYALTYFQQQPLIPFLDKVYLSKENFGKVPKFYIECLQDQAINIEDQRRMYSKIDCDIATLHLSDHSPFFSAKEQLVKLINDHI